MTLNAMLQLQQHRVNMTPFSLLFVGHFVDIFLYNSHAVRYRQNQTEFMFEKLFGLTLMHVTCFHISLCADPYFDDSVIFWHYFAGPDLDVFKLFVREGSSQIFGPRIQKSRFFGSFNYFS